MPIGRAAAKKVWAEYRLLTGAVLWEADNNQSFGATTLANGVVLSGFTGLSETDLPAVKAYAAQRRSSGSQLLAVFPTQVNGSSGYGELGYRSGREIGILWLGQLL